MPETELPQGSVWRSSAAWLGAALSIAGLVPALRWAAKRDTKITIGTVSTHHDAGLLLLTGAIAAVPALVGGVVGRHPKMAVLVSLGCLVIAGIAELAVWVITWPTF